MKKIFIIIIILNIGYSHIPKYNEPEYYSIISMRQYTLRDNLDFYEWNDYIDIWSSYKEPLYSVSPYSTAWAFDFGYRKPFNDNKYMPRTNEYILFHNYFFKLEFDGVDYTTDWGDDSFSFLNAAIGYGIGVKTSKRFQINFNVQYNFLTNVDSEPVFDNLYIPGSNYISFNIGVGFTNYYKSGWGQYGLHYNKPFNKHYINSNLPVVDANEFGVEINPIISAGGLVIAGIAWLLVESDLDASDYDSPSSSSSSSYTGCHVYGKIKFVEYGEDYKVRFVNYGEDLKVKYVDYSADSPGEWKVVEYGEDYKVKIVSYGEDFKAKEVSFGQGCN